MDMIDCKILSQLQRNGQISMARLADQVGLSLSACHRRVKLLEGNGKIAGYAAQLNRRKIGLEFQAFNEIKLISAQKKDIAAFEQAIALMPEVLECHMISGDFDYLVRVAARDTQAYETLYRDRLTQIPSVSQVKTLLSLSTVKEFQGFHLDHCT